MRGAHKFTLKKLKRVASNDLQYKQLGPNCKKNKSFIFYSSDLAGEFDISYSVLSSTRYVFRRFLSCRVLFFVHHIYGFRLGLSLFGNCVPIFSSLTLSRSLVLFSASLFFAFLLLSILRLVFVSLSVHFLLSVSCPPPLFLLCFCVMFLPDLVLLLSITHAAC